MSRAFYATTPIYYVNAEPHIGHTYTTVLVDCLARYHRLAGDRTFFLTGTDEHGEKIAEIALERRCSPREVANRYSAAFRSTWETLGFSFDRFIRTTDPDHVALVQRLLQQLHDAGQIDFREYEGLYCVGCERFLTERDMADGLCRDHERAPEKRLESNYFFRMGEHFEWLVDHIESHPDFIQPERYRNETLGMLRGESGLGDLSISRPKSRLDWGIELPFDREHVIYVWVDALINYLTAIGGPGAEGFEELWSESHHFIGKDILKPHTIFWPTLLHGLGLPPPRAIHVHGYWNVDGRKVSKSLGNMIDPLQMQQRYGFAGFRWFLLREMVFGLDASFSEELFVERVNADLANNLGNLVSRTLNMTWRFAEGRVPEPGPPEAPEREVAEAAGRAAERVDSCMRSFEAHRALEAIVELLDLVNRYLEGRAPWQAAKQPGLERQVATTLYTSCEALRVVALLAAPFLPEAAGEMASRLGLPDALAGARLPRDAARWGALRPGTRVEKGPALFPRLELQGRPDVDR